MDTTYLKQLPIIIAIIIFLLIIAIFLPKAVSKEESMKKINNKFDIEVIDSNDLLPNEQSDSQGIQSSNLVENLGAAAVGDGLGSESEAEEFYGHSNADKLLEGKEIQIDK